MPLPRRALASLLTLLLAATVSPLIKSAVPAAADTTPPQLQISNESIEYGSVPVGTTATETFTVRNGGGTALQINKSTPPSGAGAFSAVTTLDVGTILQPGQSVLERVNFTPTVVGEQTAGWIIQGNDGTGDHNVAFHGTATPAPLSIISAGDVDVTLPLTGSTTAGFPLTLSSASTSAVSVAYKTVDGSSTVANGDYVAATGTATFAPGQTSVTVPVTVNGKTVASTQKFGLSLSAPAGATLAGGGGQAYVANVTLPAIVNTANTSVAAPPNGGSATLQFPVTVNGINPGQTVTVTAATADGSAVAANGDYTPVTKVLTFDASHTSQTVSVVVLHAPAAGTNTTVLLNLSGISSDADIADSRGTGVIVNGAPPQPVVYVNSVSLTRPLSGTTTANFNLNLVPASTQNVTVLFQLGSNSTLVPGPDFDSFPAETVTFNAGETSKTIPVTVYGSATSSGTGTISVNIGKPSNATVGYAGAKAYVVSPLHHTFVSDQSVQAWVSPSETTTVNVPVTLQAPSTIDTTVTASTVDGTAKAGTDYTATSASVTIPAGQTQGFLPVTIAAGSSANPTRAFTVKLSGGSAPTVIVNSVATVTLVPPSASASVPPTDAAPVFTAASPPASATAGSPYSYTFQASGYPTPAFSVVGGQQLPPGLILDAAGLLSGIPNQNGSYTFQVTATNGVGSPAVTSPLTITVASAVTSTNVAEDNFARSDLAVGWGTTTSNKGVAPVQWAGDLGTSSNAALTNQTGIIHPTGTNGHKLAGFANTPRTYVGGDTLAEISFSAVGHAVGGVIVQRQGTGQWYQADLNTSTGQLQLVRRYNQIMDFVQTAPFTATPNTRYWLRLDVQVVGSTEVYQARFWQDGTPEPSTWMVSFTDNSPLPAGYPGAMGDWFKSPLPGEEVQFHAWAYSPTGPATSPL